MSPSVNDTIKALLTQKLVELEAELNADVISYTGQIVDGVETHLLKIVEDLIAHQDKKDTLYVVLTTGGGSATAVERYVNILRQHYTEVNFIVPDYAYSAGTIFCMSGDNIYMDYSSVLGPIDPQVQNKEGRWVAALGYLDKINELIDKAQKNTLTNAEFLILKDFDLAELKGYEQAKELTISLLKKWLVNYKFKNWNTHATTPGLIGSPVTLEQKERRAEEIADDLSNNTKWKSHGRPINIETLQTELKLKIEDYTHDKQKRDKIRSYYDLLADFNSGGNDKIFVHTRIYI
ncbi:serine dehydrogenasease [Mucilaginibacter galii]|uniref:Serine dehydrogenasease n=1 Tax=Mucilaginibacter galii TaxID=2005073 RepID=A0A917N2Q5_9SPHI|nr:serine dehydrogenasease [Mucilaginibacter galii]GGI52176.1 hypothetical protein GCM10011425_33880 [Mucilaginibacter galii]